MKSFFKISRNEKGQVAIFVALIFQLLFLFFAMIINVGLLVHHKINLQNSVDLAAYYGAMKQAEMLNAMAHVNYQIRQSWKLLAWRYRVIGTGGALEPGGNPFNLATQQLDPSLDQEGPHPRIADAFKAPVFCGVYAPLKFFDQSGEVKSDPGENLCRGILSGGSRIALFDIPKISAAFISIAEISNIFSRRALESAQSQCRWSGFFNFTTLSTWVVGFNFDQLTRRLLIAKMAKGLSLAEDDFLDIDGESGKEGIKNTLLNNLTDANRESVQFEVLNGFRRGECYGSPAGEFDPPAWLSEISFFPAFLYQDNVCADDGKNVIEPLVKILNQDEKNLPRYQTSKGQQETVKQIAPLLGVPGAPYQYTLGYEKNPWCMGYVGVKAKSTPKIPFSPADFELTAKAFAKPFGGRMGPWYFKNWPSGSFRSSGSNENPDEKIDPLAPPRLTDPNQIADPETARSAFRAANYARFPGDRLGLMSMLPLGQYIKAIHDRNVPIVINDWDQILFERSSQALLAPGKNMIGDMLAWGWANNQKPPIRDIEAAAVAPDQFDITYYSIEPNFYENYLKRMKDGKLLQKIGYTWPLRGDIGSRFDGNPEFEKFSIKNQIEIVKTKIPQGLLDHDTKLTHIVRDPFQVLTSWTSKDLLDYSSIPEGGYFGGCIKPVSAISSDKQTPFPGDCLLGGRTGYSVKLISSDYLLSQDLELGGPTSRGPILNPPDPNW